MICEGFAVVGVFSSAADILMSSMLNPFLCTTHKDTHTSAAETTNYSSLWLCCRCCCAATWQGPARQLRTS
jgi:hypothetical protein